MIYTWFIHQDRISCFCFMFLIVTLDACKSTNCQGDMDPTSAGKMFDVPKTTSRYLKGWRCRWFVAGRLPCSAAHVQVVDIHEWYPLNKNVSTISTSTGCVFLLAVVWFFKGRWPPQYLQCYGLVPLTLRLLKHLVFSMNVLNVLKTSHFVCVLFWFHHRNTSWKQIDPI